MEFNEKLQELRKQKGLTQEELAQSLFVSRTAVSKWESGRGYPSIDSLKEIAKFFSVTIDELLSGDEVLMVAEEDSKKKQNHTRDLVFGVIDISVAMFFFLPFFGQNADGVLQEVSLLDLTFVSSWLRIVYYAVVIGVAVWGVLTLALQNCNKTFWLKSKSTVSLLMSAVAALVFIVSSQPYGAALLFVFLMIKAVMCIKRE